MINYYFKSSRDKQFKDIASYKKGSLVVVESPKQSELEELNSKYDLDIGFLYDAIDVDEVPRLEKDNKFTYIFMRYAVVDEESVVSTNPVLFAIGKDALFIVSTRAVPRLSRLLSGKIEVKSSADSASLFLKIMDQIVDHYEVKLNGVSRQISSVRSRLKFQDVNNKDFITFVGIEDSLNGFMSSLTPTDAILRRLMLGKYFKMSADDTELIEDLLLNNQQSIEACKSSLKSIVNIREAYSTIMSNNLNRVIRILTVVTVVISIPTLLASLYGMNVDLPGQESSNAFWIIIAASVLSSVATLIVLRIKKWF